MGGKWDISNKQRIGFSEVQLGQKMIDGVKKLIALEEELVAGSGESVDAVAEVYARMGRSGACVFSCMHV